MKKTLICIAALVTTTLSASYQLGTIKELSISHDRATFQIETANGGYDGQNVCDLSKELNFTIDLSKSGGMALFNTIKEIRTDGKMVGVNGSGVCMGDEFEEVDSIAPFN
jgi:hypothetical protein